MNPATQAHQATWTPIMKAALRVAGFASALYRAALQARLGRDPEGMKFAALAARLPARDRERLLGQIT